MLTAHDVMASIDRTGDAMLVYGGNRGLLMTSAKGPQAKRIFQDSAGRVIGVYNLACKYEWLVEDMRRFNPE